MRLFLAKTTRFLGLQLGLFLAVWLLGNHNPGGLMSAGVDKRQRLRSAPPPRLVLVGGSSTAFGFNSRQIQDKLKVNPVNMGLHAALGLRFMLSEIQDEVRPGDVVVLALEYEHYLHDNTQPALVLQSFRHEPALALRYYGGLGDFTDHGLTLVTILLKGLRGENENPVVFQRTNYNSFGDILNRPGIARPKSFQKNLWEKQADGRLPAYFHKAVAQINDFTRHCAGRGAAVYVFYPPRPEPFFNQSLYTQLDAELSRTSLAKPLNRPQDEVYPANAFYDTDYHLDVPAVEKRTQRLIEALKQARRGVAVPSR